MIFQSLGLVSYQEALAMQYQRHEQCRLGLGSSCVLLLEHPPTITFGKHAKPAYLLLPPAQLIAQGIAIIHSERGGEITAHMPGQLVVYPIFSFKERPLSIKRYINLLEEVVITTLDTFGLSSIRDKRNPGVWVQDKKICALGIRISQRVAFHGLALNVCNDLSLFSAINPCGLGEGSVTSMQQLLANPISVAEVARGLIKQFAKCFEISGEIPCGQH